MKITTRYKWYKLLTIISNRHSKKVMVVVLTLFSFQLTIAQNLIQYVQPLAGTAPSTTVAALKHSEAGSEKNANTIPSVTLPFAMTQWTPQTRQGESKCVPPYFYGDTLLTGFRGSHWLNGSCTQDYGSFTVMPVLGKLRTTPDAYAISFSHEQEFTSPNYYQLSTPDFKVAMTPTLRCGFMQFTMQRDDSLYLLVMPNSDYAKGFVEVNEKTGEVWGYNPVHRIYQGWGEPAGFNGWFYVKVERKFSKSGTFSSEEIFNRESIRNKHNIGAFVGFALRKGETVRLRIGTSFTSLEAAKNNLAREIGNKDFETIKRLATTHWEKALSQIRVKTNNERDKKVFYTALYHAMQHPRLFSDVDGSYPAFAGNAKTMRVKKGDYYDDFSMWDIYRAQLPLFEILSPKLTNDFARSIVLKAEQGKWMPIFPCWNSYTAAMIGDHATAFIASAYNKGIRDYDVQKAYQYMRKSAFEIPNVLDYKNGKGRRALSSYLQYGFIPMEDSVPEAFHKREQVSRTLEYAFDDYALSVMAKQLHQTADYKQLHDRAYNYKNVFDTAVGSVRGRYQNGRWYQPFNADKRELYITEGTPRQYTFYVPQDIPGLVKLMGGSVRFEQKLDTLFDNEEYWHGNEPGHQIPFLYNYTSAPYKTQQRVRQILNEEYSDGPGGLSGNDDAGQMSAWYVFGAMGFYPVDPVSNNYQLASPLFDNIIVKLPENKTFEIKTIKSSSSAIYIESIRWNGKMYSKNFITYRMLLQGGKLEMWLTDRPTSWGSNIDARPLGLSN